MNIHKLSRMGVGMVVLFLFLSACSSAYPFEKGFQDEYEIKVDQDIKVGNLNKTGWELSVPKDSFSAEHQLIFQVLSSEESQSFTQEDFDFIGTPIALSLQDGTNVRLETPLQLTMKIPKDQLTDLLHEELFFAYYTDSGWEYTIPDAIDLDKGLAYFTLYHFSRFGFGRPSEEKQIETYAKDKAKDSWLNESEKNAYIASTSQQFNDLFDSMGVESRSARNQLIADIISYVDESDVGYFDYMAQSAIAASKGKDGSLDFENKWKEFVGKALYASLNKDPAGFSSKVNIIGNLASAAGSIAGGDSKAALQSIANVLNSAVPLSQIAVSTSAFIAAKANQAIDYWAESELEKAYQVYATGVGGKYGYEDGLKGDFETIFILLGGGQRQFEIRIIEKYCKKMQDEACNLSDQKRAELINNARTALKDSFDKRIIAEREISRIQSSEESFIAALKAEGLLGASNYASYFGIEKGGRNFNIADRLDRLYTIRQSIWGLIDKSARASMTDEFMAKAIDQWIYWNERGDREGFMRYLKEMGYIQEPLIIDKKLDGYWMLTETRTLPANLPNNRSGSVSSGSANFNAVAPSAGDSFSASMSWNPPGSKYYAGQTIQLNLSVQVTGYVWNGKNDGYIHMGLNYMNAHISARIDMSDMNHGSTTGGATSFMDKDKKYHASVSTDNGKIVVPETTLDTQASFGVGSKPGATRSIYVSTTAGTIEYLYTWNE